MIKVGFTCGAFDIVHAGHALMFKEAKEVCDYLIVGLQVNPAEDRPEKNAPVERLWERYIKLKSIRDIDEIIPYQCEQDLIDLLLAIQPDIRIIGQDWFGKPFTGHDLPIEVYYNKRQHHLSSTDLKNRVFEVLSSTTKKNS